MKTKLNILKDAIAVVLLLVLDQFTKLLVQNTIRTSGDIPFIGNALVFRYYENDSAAFSMDPITLLNNLFQFKAFEDPATFLRAKMIFFAILTLIVLAVLFWAFRKIPSTKKFLPLNITCVFFFAGAIGNCIDRVWHNYVIDFIYFKLINFPIFNVADIYVTCSAIAFIILLVFIYKEEDLKEIKLRKHKKSEDD